MKPFNVNTLLCINCLFRITSMHGGSLYLAPQFENNMYAFLHLSNEKFPSNQSSNIEHFGVFYHQLAIGKAKR